jgi:hypothetical protein
MWSCLGSSPLFFSAGAVLVWFVLIRRVDVACECSGAVSVCAAVGIYAFCVGVNQ